MLRGFVSGQGVGEMAVLNRLPRLVVISVLQWDNRQGESFAGGARARLPWSYERPRSWSGGDPDGQWYLDVAGGVTDYHEDVVGIERAVCRAHPLMVWSALTLRAMSRTLRPELLAARLSTVSTEVRGSVSVGLGHRWPMRLLYRTAVWQPGSV